MIVYYLKVNKKLYKKTYKNWIVQYPFYNTTVKNLIKPIKA